MNRSKFLFACATRFAAMLGRVSCGLLLLPVIASFTPAHAATSDAADCDGLIGKTFGTAVVYETDVITPPFVVGSLGAPGHGAPVTVPFCRVRAVSRPTADSNIQIEVWLPQPSAWNGRYQGVGNGGFAGNIYYDPMAWALKGGFAVAATDTGHVGGSMDSAWAIGHLAKVVDLGWRSEHEMALTAKAVIDAYYGKKPVHSYFAGCSTGGRQALVEAQRFPQDYDGIAAGDPAASWPRLLAFDATIYKTMATLPGSWLSPQNVALLNATSLKHCHGVNGLIDDPGACHSDPATVACSKTTAKGCLTPNELALAHIMYNGIHDRAGKLIYPGLTPGLERAWSLWKLGYKNEAGRDALAFRAPTGFYGNLIHQDPSWTIDKFNLDTDLPAALNSPTGAALYSVNPDLRPFFARGGKLIQYHGWNDPAIPSAWSVLYHQSVADKVGSAGLDQSYRLFLGTGMLHCGGGPGPNVIGGVSGVPPVRDADHDVVAALERWVEKGKAPDRIIATHYTDNNPAKGIDQQRPWCPYPQVARYIGGDRSKLESYECGKSDQK